MRFRTLVTLKVALLSIASVLVFESGCQLARDAATSPAPASPEVLAERLELRLKLEEIAGRLEALSETTAGVDEIRASLGEVAPTLKELAQLLAKPPEEGTNFDALIRLIEGLIVGGVGGSAATATVVRRKAARKAPRTEEA